MSLTRVLLLRCIIAACFVLLSVVPSEGQRYIFKAFGQAEGLKNLNVDSMLQDRTGFLWLGTDNGLFRYDGSRFLEFNVGEGLANPYVLALVEDPSGRLWAGTGGGLFHREGERFREVLYEGKSLAVSADSSMSVLKDGRLVVVSHYRLYVVAAGAGGGWSVQPAANLAEFRSLLATESINSILVTQAGSTWVSCGLALCEFKDGKLRRWGAAEGVPATNLDALFLSRDGTLWARNNNRVIALPPGAARFEDRTGGELGKFSNNYYVSFVETPDGKVATPSNKGLALWKDGRWQFFDSAQGLSTYPVTSLLVDRHGHLWMGVGGHGMIRWLGYGTWESWTVQEGLKSPIVWGILTDAKRRIWAAGDGGVSVSDPARTHFHSLTAGLGNAARGMQGISEDHRGRVWAIGGQGVLLRIDSETFEVERYPDLPSGHQVYADSHDRVWISTAQGLYVVNGDTGPGKGSETRVDLAGTPISDVYRVVEDRTGTLWAAGLEGLFRLEGDVWRTVPLDAAGLSHQLVDLDCDPDGSLWVITDFSRVWHLDIADGHIVKAERMGPQQVSSEAALFVRSDFRARVWVGNDRGVDVRSGGRWQLLSSEDGLLWNDVNAKAFFADRDGTVWIGTSEGISHYRNPGLIEARSLAVPRIDSLSYGGARPGQCMQGCSWQRTPLDIDFSSLSFDREQNLVYRYRLSDIDPDWITTNQASVHYPPVPPGGYTFELISTDPISHTVSPVARIRFVIRPRWWQTLAARLIGVQAVGALLFLLWRLRIRQLVRRQQVLENLISLRTRELQEQATRDGLTGLWNHKRIVELLHSEFDRACRSGTTVAVVLIDLDFFKEVNDEYGHLAGDSVLREVGRRFTNGMRSYDAAGRYGGEEFLVLIHFLAKAAEIDADALTARLEVLKASLTEETFRFEDKSIAITCSLGVALADAMFATSADEVLIAADRALYRAKKEGRNRIVFAGS